MRYYEIIYERWKTFKSCCDSRSTDSTNVFACMAFSGLSWTLCWFLGLVPISLPPLVSLRTLFLTVNHSPCKAFHGLKLFYRGGYILYGCVFIYEIVDSRSPRWINIRGLDLCAIYHLSRKRRKHPAFPCCNKVTTVCISNFVMMIITGAGCRGTAWCTLSCIRWVKLEKV